MRFVDRGQFEPPKFLESPEFHALREELEELHDAEKGGRRGHQESKGFEELFARFREEAIEALRIVFAGKCAYTERPEEPDIAHVFHLHRPGGDALGLDSKPSPEHYWWLQTDWSNWMLASQQAASIKANNFPVVGDRLNPEEKSTEIPILINPCEEDPCWWLSFDKKGGVRSRRIESTELNRKFGNVDRGEINIRSLDLNSEDLRYLRLQALRGSFQRVRKMLRAPGAPIDPVYINSILEPSNAFLGPLRQQLAYTVCDSLVHTLPPNLTSYRRAISWVAPEIASDLCANPARLDSIKRQVPAEAFASLFDPVVRVVSQVCPDLEWRFELTDKAAASFSIDAGDDDDAGEELKTGFSVGSPSVELESLSSKGGGPGRGKKPPRRKTPSKPTKPELPAATATPPDLVIDLSARLKEVQIRNFKAIEDLTFRLPDRVERIRIGSLEKPRERASAVNWKMLLGENACGKSSILQAIALALYGPEIETEPPVDVGKVRRRGSGNKQSFVKLTFRGYEPIKLKLLKRGFKYEKRPDYKLFIRAYGATRLLEGDREIDPAARRRVENLFDPRYPVVDVNNWLMGLPEDDGDFNVASRAIRDLIAGVGDDPTVPSELKLDRDPNTNKVTLGGNTLDELSDGYRSLLALICDIMAGLGGLSDMENALGIVLLDEIGAHLHPRLRMQIVPRLRFLFPQIQFICSTHEPLCLRGLFEEEVDRVRRLDGRVESETLPRSPSSYRVDQLLTSEFFGMETTIDPEIDGEFQVYYHLLNKTTRTADEETRLSGLRRRLITEGVLGYTRRDQLVYEAIDKYLAGPANSSSVTARNEAKTKALDRVKELWGFAEVKQRVENEP